MSDEISRSYRAYLIRCWQDRSGFDEEPSWRFSVEEILPERRRRGFGNLEALVAFLQAELARRPGESRDEV